MTKSKVFTDYEETLIKVINNVVEKLVSSIILHESEQSFTSAFFLTVIAEEEISKLYLLPIVNEYGGLDDFLKERGSAFYNHKAKQRVFSSYVYFNRKWDEIEEKKQKALYVSINSKGKVDFCKITPKESFDEIKNASCVFQYQMKHIANEKSFSPKFIKACLFFTEILGGCIREKMPEVLTEMKKDIRKFNLEMKKDKKKAENKFLESLFKNPYELIRILKAALGGDEYKDFLRKTHRLSFHEMVQELGKELNIKD